MRSFKEHISEGSHDFKDFKDPWAVMSPEDRKEANRLFKAAMKAMPSSQKQKELHAKLMVLYKKYGIGQAQVSEMFGIPNKVAGMWMLAILVGGNLQVYLSKDKKALANVEHHSIVQHGSPQGRTLQHLRQDAKPEDVLHDLRVAYKPNRVEIEVLG